MNCPHGRDRAGCPVCLRSGAAELFERSERTERLKKADVVLGSQLVGCKHRKERVDGGARWCIDCGAYFPAEGIVKVRHTSLVTLAHLMGFLGPDEEQ